MKIITFIESLKKLTESRNIVWNTLQYYLDTEYNSILEDYIINKVQYNYRYNNGEFILTEKSYVANAEGSYVYLFNFDGKYRLFVQNQRNTDIREVSCSDRKLKKEYNIKVTKLAKKIIEDINSEEKTIDKVIEMARYLD